MVLSGTTYHSLLRAYQTFGSTTARQWAQSKDPRPLGSSNDVEDEDPRRPMHALTIAALLPSACAWIGEAGQNIILLSEVSWNVAEFAAKAIDTMLDDVKERNSMILRVFETAGGAVHQDKDFWGLKKK
ncbi:uncharacterized protein ACLA_032620 [Aspergillus clavatus NRRL 1]|uniref:Uncharacterized protein n=1 Tax=Aspergillus clavatus (strain ATCC 1007 / CBS 513.65 / DSM 816 / NCTC 3887 / NRRL 1 / QM 1276 / 107) TaxID=344612 RepID=A1CSA5_ASPCL|nr:uncharacterized protein ACLA_032620 [Aspergillus clavatus NRRL 1]EAW08526.1 hypothetical protein ACLA_032620 [Aspergillus clavatus NRRL 1]